jgi:hypothetical protein
LTGVLLTSVAAVGNHAAGATPEAGDFDADRKLDADDIDQLTAAILAGEYSSTLDLNEDLVLDQNDRVVWVEDLAQTYFGDTNLNGVFNTGDLVHVFQAGQYEDDVTANSTWATGDWSGDAEFGSEDLVLAFASGAFEGPPRLPNSGGGPLPVPEPSALALLGLGLVGLISCRQRAGRSKH